MHQIANMVHEFNWATCPVDILILILRKLDAKSLINCMDVSKLWREVVDYYCEHLNLWRSLVKESVENEGIALAEKSTLGWHDQFLSAQGWLNIRNLPISLHNQYKFELVRNICVHKDKLIVTTNTAVIYYDIETFEQTKRIEKSCFSYEETSFLIIELLTEPIVGEYNVLALTNKLHSQYENTLAPQPLQNRIILTVCLYKIHLNSCYFTDATNVLWVCTANGNCWDKQCQARYYGNKDSMCSISIHKTEVYILLKRGDVLLVNQERKQFEKIFNFCEYLHNCAYLNEKCFMFQIFGIIVEENQIIAMIRPGITCLKEHGHALLLGYEDGKIEIYLIKKMVERSIPEVQFNLQDYVEEQLLSPKINEIDVFEDISAHHLFVSTNSNVYELLLRY